MPKQKKDPELFPHSVDSTPISVGNVWLTNYAKSPSGAVCPCCSTVIRYRGFKIDSKLARLLIILYRTYPVDGATINVKQLIEALSRKDIVTGREWNKLRYWGLVAAEKNTDVCVLTQKGQDFVYRSLQVPKQIWVDKDALVAVAPDTVTIQNALGKNHNYDTWMTVPSFQGASNG
jgi:hypothetical protein